MAGTQFRAVVMAQCAGLGVRAGENFHEKKEPGLVKETFGGGLEWFWPNMLSEKALTSQALEMLMGAAPYLTVDQVCIEARQAAS